MFGEEKRKNGTYHLDMLKLLKIIAVVSMIISAIGYFTSQDVDGFVVTFARAENVLYQQNIAVDGDVISNESILPHSDWYSFNYGDGVGVSSNGDHVGSFIRTNDGNVIVYYSNWPYSEKPISWSGGPADEMAHLAGAQVFALDDGTILFKYTPSEFFENDVVIVLKRDGRYLEYVSQIELKGHLCRISDVRGVEMIYECLNTIYYEDFGDSVMFTFEPGSFEYLQFCGDDLCAVERHDDYYRMARLVRVSSDDGQFYGYAAETMVTSQTYPFIMQNGTTVASFTGNGLELLPGTYPEDLVGMYYGVLSYYMTDNCLYYTVHNGDARFDCGNGVQSMPGTAASRVIYNVQER